MIINSFSDLKKYVAAFIVGQDQCTEKYNQSCKEVRRILAGHQLEQLKQLVNKGPVWDGDVISKGDRDDLLQLKLASRACVKGEQGYTVANYYGWDVLKSDD